MIETMSIVQLQHISFIITLTLIIKRCNACQLVQLVSLPEAMFVNLGKAMDLVSS